MIRLIAISCGGAALAFLVSCLPLIPGWKSVQIATIFALVASALLLLGVDATFGRRSREPEANGAGSFFKYVLLAAIPITVGWLALLESIGANVLVAEEVVASLRDTASGDQVFVYSRSGIPNGFLESRVAARRNWLPFEATILRIEEPLSRANKLPTGIELEFGSSGSSLYRYATGQLTQLDTSNSTNRQSIP